MRRHPVRALALTLALLPAAPQAAELLGSHVWEPGWSGAGGFSGLWLDADGAGFVAISDRGGWVRGTLARDGRGAVSDVALAARGLLGRTDGGRGAAGMDAEGLARTGGRFVVSYETEDRVMDHGADLSARPTPLPMHGDFGVFRINTGLEALAADAEGRLYAVPERFGRVGAPFPVYRYDGRDGGTGWVRAFDIPAEGTFRAVGADVGPDGRLYVLERDFALIGFRSRIRSMALDGTGLREEVVTPLRRHDNLEGLSVWRDGAGRLRATMISDDNQRAVQVTEFVDYVLGEGNGPEG